MLSEQEPLEADAPGSHSLDVPAVVNQDVGGDQVSVREDEARGDVVACNRASCAEVVQAALVPAVGVASGHPGDEGDDQARPAEPLPAPSTATSRGPTPSGISPYAAAS